MRQIYLRKDYQFGIRKIMIDMSSLVSHKNIRLPKEKFEDQLYLPYLPDVKNKTNIEKYFLLKEDIIKEDDDFYYFSYKFKPEQVEETAY